MRSSGLPAEPRERSIRNSKREAKNMKSVMAFTFYAARKMLLGGSAYYLWLVCLGVLIAVGITGYHEQFVWRDD